jgi:hypothetical protein
MQATEIEDLEVSPSICSHLILDKGAKIAMEKRPSAFQVVLGKVDICR